MNPNISNFQELYDAYYTKSFTFAKSYVQDHMVAEDIVAESFIKLWKITSEKEIDYPQALLFTTLRNRALDYLRQHTLRHTIEEELADIYQEELNIRISTLEACNPEQLFSNEIELIIKKTLESLPEQTCRVFEMSRFEGMHAKEIAEKLNITTKTVEYHITRTLKVLRINLKDYLLFCFLFLN